MPEYHYVCEHCPVDIEIFHSAKDCDDPNYIKDVVRKQVCTKWKKIYELCESEMDEVIFPLSEHIPKDLTKDIDENCKLRRVPCSTGLLVFNMMTPEQKKEAIRKRSHEHYEKEIKDRKKVMDEPSYIPK